MKFGFIFKTGCSVGKDFIVFSKAGDTLAKVIGVESVDMGREGVEILSQWGVKIYDFSGDFSKEQLGEYEKIFSGEYQFNLMKYLPGQREKLEKVKDLSKYGVIVRNGDIEGYQREELVCPKKTATIYFVKDLEKAKEAIKEMIKEGVEYVELCSYFNLDRTKQLIEEVGGKIPIGTSGKI